MRRGLGIHNRRSPGVFNPLSLFQGGIVQGAWYDPSDLTTLFQDSAGTTPVTAVEQPVGRILDKSGRGNHAYQTTSASRPTLRARYNLLTYSEQFDNAAWTKQATTVSANATTAPDGTATADKIVEDSTNAAHSIFQNFTSSITPYAFSFYAKAAERTWARTRGDAGLNYFNLSTGAIGTLAAGRTATITDAGNGWWRVVVRWSATGTGVTNVQVGPTTGDGVDVYTGDGTSGIFAWGAQLVPTAVFPSNTYQRIGASTDYATGAAFPPYLAFDGVDDSLLTNSVDFTGTDKMLVVAGVTKQSDAASGTIVDLNGATGTGAFMMRAPSGALANYAWFSGGTVAFGGNATSAASYPAPITNIATGIANIAAPTTTLRVNGVQVATDSASQGTGNYSNLPLYVGRRQGTSLPFNGNLYNLIIAGQSYAAGQVTSTEQWVAARTPLGSI